MPGRLSKEKLFARTKELLEFIYNFRYPVREQIYRFGRIKWGVAQPRVFLEQCAKQGYLAAEKAGGIAPRLYQLTTAGKSYLGQLGSGFVQRGKRVLRYDCFAHDTMVLEIYLKLLETFKEGTWLSDWRVRAMIRREHGLKASRRAPDGIFTQGEQNLAVEFERTKKGKDRIGVLVGKYKREFEKGYICGLLVITENKLFMERLKKQISKGLIKWPEEKVIYGVWGTLEKGKAEHLGKEIGLGEIFKALKQSQ